MQPEFYCLKYEGLQTPAKLVEDSSNFGWKCRKYQRWKQIHTGDGDKEFLKEMGDSLVENGTFDIKNFGKFSEIFLNVQKWRYDKENLLQDPPHYLEWDEIEQLILLGDESKSLLKRHLNEIGLSNVDIRADVAHAFVAILRIFQLAEEVGLSETGCHTGLVEDESNACSINSRALLETIRAPLSALYESVDLQPPDGNDLYSVLAALCIDLGFNAYPKIEPVLLGEFDIEDVHQAVIARLDSLDPAKLFSVDYVRGVIVVSVNKNHPFVTECLMDDAATRLLGKLALAYGIAANDMFGSARKISTFTSYLGLALTRDVDERGLDQFVQQVRSLGNA